MKITPRGNWVQQLRLYSGLVLFTYAFFHFINHALGLVSIEAMTRFQDLRLDITRSLPVTIILMSAMIVHPGLALGKLAFRSTLKMPVWELIQILFGLSIPALMIPHLVHTRIAYQKFAYDDNYRNVLAVLWPDSAWQQSALLMLVWIHGCIGIHFWLRLSALYRRFFLPLLVLATIIPVLGIAGFTVAGRTNAVELAEKAEENTPGEADYDSRARSSSLSTAKANEASLEALEEILLLVFYALLITSGVIYSIGYIRRRSAQKIVLDYKGGPDIRSPIGPSLLEISRSHGIPHAAVCGGRARCSTCRVQITKGIEHLPPPSETEAATLQRVKAGPDVRLACQVHPKHAMEVTLLLRPAGAKNLTRQFLEEKTEGIERNMAVLFFDVRGFTSLSADKLPYDVVFLLNQLFESVGAAILSNGGWIDKYLGDGLMAVFGRETDLETACVQALSAASAIDQALDEVDEAWREETGESVSVGIGIHAGPLVIGRIGEPQSAAVTVIGRTVNAAARLEALTREHACQLIVSAYVAKKAGLDFEGFTRKTTPIRGLREPLDILLAPRARDLPHHGSS